MRRGKASEWTLLRQLAGNILPYLHWLPTFIVAWILIALFEGSALATVLVLVGVFASLTVGTWALFDRYSMFQNAEMRRALRARLRSSIPDLPAGRSWFVGMATQGYFSLLDTDEDVGYLALFPDRLAYVGDRISLSIPRTDILGIDRRAVPGCSLLGYYWSVIRIEDPATGKETSLRFLSREVDRLSQQPAANRQLWKSVSEWYNETATALVLPGGSEAAAAAREEALRELRSLLEPQVVEPPIVDRPPSILVESPVTASQTTHTVRAEGAAAHLSRQLRDMIRDSAPWETLRPLLANLLRCLEAPEEMQANSELLLGVYVALRGRAAELRLHLAALPPEHQLQSDEELTPEYEAVFAEPAAPEPGEAAWRSLRRGRRLQAIAARGALRGLLEGDGA